MTEFGDETMYGKSSMFRMDEDGIELTVSWSFLGGCAAIALMVTCVTVMIASGLIQMSRAEHDAQQAASPKAT